MQRYTSIGSSIPVHYLSTFCLGFLILPVPLFSLVFWCDFNFILWLHLHFGCAFADLMHYILALSWTRLLAVRIQYLLIAFLSAPQSSMNPNTSLVIWTSTPIELGRLSYLSVKELWAFHCASFIGNQGVYDTVDFSPLFLRWISIPLFPPIPLRFPGPRGNHHLIWHLLNSTASCVFIYRHLSLYLAASSSYSRLPGSSAFSVTLSQISLGSDLGMGFVNTFTTIWSNLTYGCLPLRLLWAIWLVEDMEHVVINEES